MFFICKILYELYCMYKLAMYVYAWYLHIPVPHAQYKYHLKNCLKYLNNPNNSSLSKSVLNSNSDYWLMF